MDWNKNGKIDASDILITELFQEELKNDVSDRLKDMITDSVDDNNTGKGERK